MYKVYQKASRARPLSVAAATGFGVMGLGDAGVQRLQKQEVDWERTAVASTYNGAISPFFALWYRFLDGAFSSAVRTQLGKKIVINQVSAPCESMPPGRHRGPTAPSPLALGRPPRRADSGPVAPQIVVSTLNTPVFMAWCNSIEAWLHSDGPLRWDVVRAETTRRVVTEMPTVLAASLSLWIPVNTINFAFVPAHLKIPYISFVGVLWGGYVSHVAHREEQPAEQPLHEAPSAQAGAGATADSVAMAPRRTEAVVAACDGAQRSTR